MTEFSLNEVESLSAKAARGAGFAWGLAEDIGRAARAIASDGADWSDALLALLAQRDTFEPPSARRLALWRRGEPDERGERPLCPVRTAAFFNDAPPQIASIWLFDVGLPLWLDALAKVQRIWVVETDLAAARADATLRSEANRDRGRPARTARPTIAPQNFDALNAYAARTYVPESDGSRARGAGGGRVDDE